MPHIPSDDVCGSFITPGTYRVEIVSVYDTDKDGNVKKDKNDDIFWAFNVSLKEKFIGDQILDNLFFSGNQSMMRRTKDILQKFGIDTVNGLQLDNPEELIGRQAKADIEITDYNGEKKNSIKFFGGYHSLDKNIKPKTLQSEAENIINSESNTDEIEPEQDKNDIPY